MAGIKLEVGLDPDRLRQAFREAWDDVKGGDTGGRQNDLTRAVVAGNLISQGMLGILNKFERLMLDDPLLRTTAGIIDAGISLYLRPLAETINTVLQPLAVDFYEKAAQHYDDWVAAGGVTGAFDRMKEGTTTQDISNLGFMKALAETLGIDQSLAQKMVMETPQLTAQLATQIIEGDITSATATLGNIERILEVDIDKNQAVGQATQLQQILEENVKPGEKIGENLYNAMTPWADKIADYFNNLKAQLNVDVVYNIGERGNVFEGTNIPKRKGQFLFNPETGEWEEVLLKQED